MQISPITDGFGAVVTGAKLNRGDLSGLARDVEAALDEHLLLVFRGEELDQEDMVRFGQSLGQLEDFTAFGGLKGGHCLPLSNLDAEGHFYAADSLMRRNTAADALWHTDHTYRPMRARYSALLAETVPAQGGGTDFCDTRAAYAALPEAMKARLEGRVALHSIVYSRSLAGFTEWTEEQRAALPPIPQPLIFEHPRTGRKSLYIASHIAEVLGMETAEARQLACELVRFATQPQFVYSHQWRPGDLAIWDDRATMHRRAPYDDLNEVRKLYTMRVMEPSEHYDPATVYELH
jgi:alpha-ketoglutarate-dependent 2,4-dichlorophenoxyacetate dioxygenase